MADLPSQEEIDGWVLHERRGPVALITFNRPDRLNALNPLSITRFMKLLEQADEDDEVRSVVITGAGRGFCAGADFRFLQEISVEKIESAFSEAPRDMPMRIGKPLIAAINGPAAGIGLANALMADVRFAAAGAKMTTAFARLGLVAENGLSWLLPRLVGTGRAFDLLYSARPFSSEEALEMGLVQWVLPADQVLDRAVEYATGLAEMSAFSQRQMRAQIHADLARPWADSWADMEARMYESLQRPEFAEAASRRNA